MLMVMSVLYLNHPRLVLIAWLVSWNWSTAEDIVELGPTAAARRRQACRSVSNGFSRAVLRGASGGHGGGARRMPRHARLRLSDDEVRPVIDSGAFIGTEVLVWTSRRFRRDDLLVEPISRRPASCSMSGWQQCGAEARRWFGGRRSLIEVVRRRFICRATPAS